MVFDLLTPPEGPRGGPKKFDVARPIHVTNSHTKEHLAIRRAFSLVDMITNAKFSNCPNVFEIGVVWQ